MARSAIVLEHRPSQTTALGRNVEGTKARGERVIGIPLKPKSKHNLVITKAWG